MGVEVGVAGGKGGGRGGAERVYKPTSLGRIAVWVCYTRGTSSRRWCGWRGWSGRGGGGERKLRHGWLDI